MSDKVILVFDVGKSHSKITVVGLADGSLQLSRRCPSASYQAEDYLALDVETIWQWFLKQLKILNPRYSIEQIIVTTHGAAVAAIDESGLVFPIVDYEFNGYQEINKNYQSLRPHFSESGSLDLPMGLNLGRQLYWLQKQFPKQWSKIKYLLMLPQYFSWKLTGNAVSELTSLGCHSDCWDFKQNNYSSLVKDCQWQHLFPQIVACGEDLGTVTKEISELTGLNQDTRVLNGIHDSNASLVPYLQSISEPINVISSGTWTVICGLGGKHFNIDEASEMMASINYKGQTVPTIRFMGGREWQLLQPLNFVNYNLEDIRQLLKLCCYPLPAFTASGPFSKVKGIIEEEASLSDSQRSALGTLYLALMTRYCLDLLNNPGDIIVEGSFIENTQYLQLLQSLSPRQRVYLSEDASGTTLGAARLSSDSEKWPDQKLIPVEKTRFTGIDQFYQVWCTKIKQRITKPI